MSFKSRNLVKISSSEEFIKFIAFFTSGSFNSPANHRNKLHNDFVTVWKAKCEQIIMKARFSMKEDKKTLEQIEDYAKEIGL